MTTVPNAGSCELHDFKQLDAVLSRKPARGVALVPTKDALCFSSYTLSKGSRVYRLDRAGNLAVNASDVNSGRTVYLYGSLDGQKWQRVLEWRKDSRPAALFQNAKAYCRMARIPAGCWHSRPLLSNRATRRQLFGEYDSARVHRWLGFRPAIFWRSPHQRPKAPCGRGKITHLRISRVGSPDKMESYDEWHARQE